MGAHVCCHSAVTSWPSWFQLQREMDLHVSGFLWAIDSYKLLHLKLLPIHGLPFTAGKFCKRGKSRGSEHLGSREWDGDSFVRHPSGEVSGAALQTIFKRF